MLKEVTCCKDCVHRPKWIGLDLYPPNYFETEFESEIDWTCPLIDRNNLLDSWYMTDDFFCPMGETASQYKLRKMRAEIAYRKWRDKPERPYDEQVKSKIPRK